LEEFPQSEASACPVSHRRVPLTIPVPGRNLTRILQNLDFFYRGEPKRGTGTSKLRSRSLLLAAPIGIETVRPGGRLKTRRTPACVLHRLVGRPPSVNGECCPLPQPARRTKTLGEARLSRSGGSCRLRGSAPVGPVRPGRRRGRTIPAETQHRTQPEGQPLYRPLEYRLRRNRCAVRPAEAGTPTRDVPPVVDPRIADQSPEAAETSRRERNRRPPPCDPHRAIPFPSSDH